MKSNTAWLASFPKSGNTWIRALLNALESDSLPNLNSLDSGRSRAHDAVNPSLGLSLSELSEAEAIAVMRMSWSVDSNLATSYTRRKTHQPYTFAADGFPARWQPEGARAVYILRDPRAIAVSWAHHKGTTNEDSVRSMARADALVVRLGHEAHGGYDWVTWSEHVEGWTSQTDIPTLVLTYENLVAETVGCLRQIAEWLDIPYTEEKLARAVEHCSFHNLAAMEIVEGFSEAASVERVFFRKGQINAWRTELSPDLIAQIESDHAIIMKRFGYLPFNS